MECSTGLTPSGQTTIRQRFCSVVRSVSFLLVTTISIILLGSPFVAGADTDEAKKLLRSGEYQACIAMAKQEVARGVWNELWPRILLEAYLTTGNYKEALPEYEAAIQKFSTSVRLRLLGAQIYQMNNQADKGMSELAIIPELMQKMPWRFNGKDELVPLGEFFVLQGEDPKQVLEICYDRALKVDPKMVEAHIASGRLALDKYDYQVAAQSLTKALKLDELDPEIHMLLARAWSGTEPQTHPEFAHSS